jgi:hypothetical protein
VGEQDSDVELKLLDGVVEEEFLAAYPILLAADGCAGEDAEAFFGTSGLARALTVRGMAYLSPADPANPPRLIPSPSGTSVQTERRHTAALKHLLDVETRFAAKAAATIFQEPTQ